MKRILCVMALASITACDGVGFQSNQAPTYDEVNGRGDAINASTRDGSTSNQVVTDNDATILIEQARDEDDRAIAQCLASFRAHPFEKGVIPVYRKIHASVQVLSQGVAVSDTEPTTEPALVLITASVNVLGQSTYNLLNPNAWYCIKVNVNVKAETIVNICQQSKLASNKVGVNVMSQGTSASQVGVNVQSNMQVNKKGC